MHFRSFACFVVMCNIFVIEMVTIPDSMNHRNWWMMNNHECGTSVSMDKIVGGKNASLGEYPWLARIGYFVAGGSSNSNSKSNFRCGGTLITPTYVVTAAHCASNLPKGYILSTIRLGENNALTSIDCDQDVCAEPVQDFYPIKIIVHKYYGDPPYKNDIALIKLHQPAYINAWVRPICMPYGELLIKNYYDVMAEVAGWGIADNHSSKGSDYLLTIRLPVRPLQMCAEAFENYATLDYRQMCAGGIEGEDSCGGDSGGPLMRVEAFNGPPKYYMLGVVSFGAKRCGASDMPAVYTRIAVYMNWILNNLE